MSADIRLYIFIKFLVLIFQDAIRFNISSEKHLVPITAIITATELILLNQKTFLNYRVIDPKKNKKEVMLDLKE